MSDHRNRIFLILKYISILILFSTLSASASGQKLPVIDGEEAVALVNNEPITLREFNTELSSFHSTSAEEKQAVKIDYAGIMDRLITLRLIMHEAKNMGLDELPEVKEMIEQYSKKTLMGLLRGEYVRNIEVEKGEVDKLYKAAAAEFRMKSLLFENQAAALNIDKEIRAGGDFDEIVNRVMKEGLGKGGEKSAYFKGRELMPQILEQALKMEPGSVSPLISIKDGFILFRLEEVRAPENRESREKAEKEALEHKRTNMLEEYKSSLIIKYVKINEAALEGLDYESSMEEFEKLMKDARVIAAVEGEAPVTVAELTAALRQKYFHGVETALKAKKLNAQKRIFLYDTILQRRVLLKEALATGIDKMPPYKNMMKEYENSVLFDIFVKKVVIPDIKIDPAELKKYYDEHIADYTTPEMMKIHGIVFRKKEEAEKAVGSLNKGTDFKWLKASADGQVNMDEKGVQQFEGNVIIISDLTEDIRKAVSGARAGEYKLYASPEKYNYVLFIQEVFPSGTISLEMVKDEISQKVFTDRIERSINDWSKKLREVYDVEVYATEF